MALSQTLRVTLPSYKAFFDTSAVVNLVDVFRRPSSSSHNHITALPLDINLNGISGKIILPHGKVLLSLSLLTQEQDM